MFNTASCLGLAGVGDVVEQGDVLVAARLGVRYPIWGGHSHMTSELGGQGYPKICRRGVA